MKLILAIINPARLEAVKEALNDGRKSALQARRQKLDDAWKGLAAKAKQEAAAQA